MNHQEVCAAEQEGHWAPSSKKQESKMFQTDGQSRPGRTNKRTEEDEEQPEGQN